MKTTAKAAMIEAALRREGLRSVVNAIEDSQPGEVVLWINGSGIPVYGVHEALRVAKEAQEL